MPTPPRLLVALHHRWSRHPRWALAVKGSLAASLAWVVAVLAPAPFSEQPYYAPLGAIIAMSSTAVRSVRQSAQATGAVLVGAVLAHGVDLTLGSSTLSVALAVGLALLCSGWRLFGEMGGWVATSALFVLILGGSEPLEFITVYSGLIVVGAVIGTAVNLLFPPLPLTPSEDALDRLRSVLVDQAEVLADRLERSGPLVADEWQRRRRAVVPPNDRAHGAVAQTREAMRVNRRGHRYSRWAGAQAGRAEALWAAADVLDEVVRLLAEWEHTDRADVALGPEIRPVLATTLRSYAAALRSDREDDSAVRAAEAVSRLAAAVRATQRSSGDDLFVAGALVVALHRGVDALAADGPATAAGHR
ncbi:aromatic acid exporter family protein [Promicromonospora kroppenstedtii]|uniref:Aromatic acid exporter family protein n=1 Tax=Promicromonospora kroppenstedtii TaxID=440482 RepID=A0ABW7XEX5_9MICO